MSSPASIGKHPIHPMLIVFPLGLLNFSFFADLCGRSPEKKEIWKEVAKRTMAGGVISALAAAVPGFIDFLSLEGRPKKLATAHMALNLGIVGLFGYNLWRRFNSPDAPPPTTLSIAGVAGLLVSGWLGGEMVYVHGIAVDKEAGEKKEVGELGQLIPEEV